MSEIEEQIDSADPFVQLLTDALRAGPGSLEWQQAVARVNAGEAGMGDEYAMLIRARENLASGKAYREVRPGIGFTRKVMQSIAAEAVATRKNPLSAGLISYIGAGLIVASLAVFLFWLTKGGAGSGEDLTSLILSTTRLSVSLDGPLPSDWKTIGPLPVDPAKGLVPQSPVTNTEYIGGGVVSTNGIDAAEPFAVEARFQFQHVSDAVIPQLFVTDDPNFNAQRGVSPHELVWLVRGGSAQVALPDGKLTSASKKIVDGQSIQVRIVVGPTHTVVMCDGNELWTGVSQLGNAPRYIGVRLLCKKGDPQSMVSVKQLRMLTK